MDFGFGATWNPGSYLLKRPLADGWHKCSPASQGGFPIAISFEWPEGVSPVGELHAPAGHIATDPVLGTIEIRQKV
ncbi:MAG: hypothetical protein JKY61_10175 [Planctomycetes bacterium]|nr:hypothetical protein [Planctomycetota bacterium]